MKSHQIQVRYGNDAPSTMGIVFPGSSSQPECMV